MSLRTRVTLGTGLAVLVVVLAVSITVYVVVRDNLRSQVDTSLSHSGQVEQLGVSHETSVVPRHVPLVEDAFMQVVDADGEIVTAFDDRQLPVTDDVLAVARGERDEVYFDADVDGTPVRVHAASAGDGTAIQVGRSLTEIDQSLRRLIVTLVVIGVVAVGLAVVIGRVVAAAAAAPVHRVAEAADKVARTGQLSHHIAVPAGDDLGRMAASFNTMLDALSESLAKQRQLVADASHELRTPLAAVRTNVEVLARAEELTPEDRELLIQETVAQVGELTRLVSDLVELARGDGQDEPFTRVDLEEVTRRAADVIARNHPAVAFSVDGAPSPIRGAPQRVSRAVSNLIDNAAKWSPSGATVEIAVRDGAVKVRDHGPGIDPSDLPHVFDRFYRAPAARTMPGSGLGLAIVKQVADSHGGTITAARAPGGGALFALRFPVVDSDSVSELEVPIGFSSPS